MSPLRSALVCSAALLWCAQASAKPVFTTLYYFQGSPDGANPVGQVAIGAGGIIYGTTLGGGAYGHGTVFSLTPPAAAGGAWTEAVLWSFGATSIDGWQPFSGVLIGSGGVLYGTTQSAHDGAGVVYSLTPPAAPGGLWSEAILQTIGASLGGLLMDDGGVLYGTAVDTGTRGDGYVFSLAPPASVGEPWALSVLWDFGASGDGVYPDATLVVNAGVLYGTTEAGGAYGSCDDAVGCAGTVFSLTPPSSAGGSWSEAVLWSFGGDLGAGGWPKGLTVGENGILYGTTEFSAVKTRIMGNVYSLSPPSSPGGAWTEDTIFSFEYPYRDGLAPQAAPLLKGDALYITASEGNNGVTGTVLELKPPGSSGGLWRPRLLHAFDGTDGSFPESTLVKGKDGVLYGATADGAVSQNGTIYSVVP